MKFIFYFGNFISNNVHSKQTPPAQMRGTLSAILLHRINIITNLTVAISKNQKMILKMFNKYFLLILLLNGFNSFSQSYFVKGITPSLGIGSICIHDTNSFIAIGNATISQIQKGVVTQFDNSGNIMQVLTIDSMHFDKIVRVETGSFLIIAHSLKNCCTYYCIKMDSSSNIVWTKQLPAEPFLVKEFNGQYYYFTPYIGNTNLITKTDTNGIVIGQKLIRDNTFSYKYFVDDAILSTDNNIVITGSRQIGSTSSNNTFILAKIDTSLNVIWMEEINGYYENYPSNINLSFDSTFIVSGIFRYALESFGIGQLKIDSNGNVLLSRFNKPINSNNQIFSSTSKLIAPNNDNIVGCLVLEPSSDPKPIVLKYDSTLNFHFAFKYAFPHSFWGSMLSQLSSDRFYLIGATSITGIPLQILMGLDTTLLSCLSQPLPMLDSLTTLTPTIISHVQPTFTPVNLPDTVIAFQSISVVSYDFCQLLSVGDVSEYSNNLKVYPNPANAILELSFDKTKSISIINVLGEILFKKNINSMSSNKLEIDISLLPSGIYFVKTDSELKKFIKQ